ncbi:MAG: Rpn family recombination-promoting nuclease/putative transposase, partial [Gordonia sp. (in: high G+C Gram-positive bacteria)]
IVIYQGERAWTAATDVADLLDADDDLLSALGGLVPRAAYLLDDLTVVDDDALRARPLTPAVRITFVALGSAPGDPDVTVWLERWLTDLRVVGADPAHQPFIELVTYLVLVSKTPIEQLTKFTARLGPQAQEAAMTTGEQLIEQGLVQGREEGREEGRAQGRADMLLDMIGMRFGAPDEATCVRVAAASPEQVRLWVERIVCGAQTLDEVFA